MALTFQNDGDGDVEVWWDGTGNNDGEASMGVVQSGKELTVDSFSGHIFVARTVATGVVTLRHTVDAARGQRQSVLLTS